MMLIMYLKTVLL